MADGPKPPDETPPRETPADVTPINARSTDVKPADSHTPAARASRAQAKRELLAGLLDHGKVMIRLDARRFGVRVPAPLTADNDLALNLSWRYADTDMKLGERAIEATLRFQGTPFRCVVPWNALWGMVTAPDSFRIWEEDLPIELGGPTLPAEVLAEVVPAEETLQEQTVPSTWRPRLVGADEAAASASEITPRQTPAPVAKESSESSDDDEPPPKAPWLRLVR